MSGPKMKGRTGLLFSIIIAACICGITAQTVECPKATVADIVFLLDGSSSISTENFEEARNFLRNIIRALDIGSNNVQIGLAQYSDTPYKEFLLKDHTDRRSLLAAVERVPHRKGRTETGKALSFLLEQYFTEEAGSRASQRVPQIAVVITDGESSDEVAGPAQRLRERGVIVFAIGVGKAIRMELESIANWPPNRFVLTTDSYQALQRMTEEVLKTVCISVDEQRQTLADRYADIFFLLDSNMPQAQFTTFRSDLLRLIPQLDVRAAAYRMGLAQFSVGVNVEFFLNASKTKQETLSSLRRFRLRPQPNQPRNLGKALQYAGTNFFTLEAGGRAQQRSRQFLVVVTGGRSDDLVTREALLTESAGITIVGMSAGALEDEIHRFASTGFAFNSPRVSLLKDIFTTEEKEYVTDDCKGANVADIVFIVDESGSIQTENFQLVRAFLHSIASGLQINESRVRVGIVTYNETAKAQVYLNTLKTKADLLNFINILPYSGGGTNTGAALNFTREQMFTEKRGSRRGLQKVVVVITDGKSQDSVSEAAVLLRRSGVSIYAIGIKDANENELFQIASHPPSSHIFNLKSFTDLKPLKQRLQKTVCTNIIYEAFGTDRTDSKKACVEKDEADIFFLIDDSRSIKNEDFDDMKRFLLELIRSFRIGPHHVRMGLVKYADLPTLEFDLTTHSDKKSLEKAVNGTKHVGGETKTGKALSFMEPYFKRARAAPVPRYLIVITHGNSSDPVWGPAEELRRQGVKTFAVGVNESYYPQLAEISGDPKRTFRVNNFDALKSISVSIITEMCFEDACSEALYDVIFLIDSSESISEEDYKKMKDFMKAVINKSNVQNVHVGVMQFSSRYKLEFGLNEYSSEDNMSQAIDRMKQMNEGTLTGKAITEVSKYFDASRGGRPNQKQRLVVITDGAAQDEVKGPAEDLRAKGVVIYVIAVGQTKTTQLEDISGSQDRVFYRSNFDLVKDLDRQLTLKLCDEDCKKTKKADIIFLVDGSGSIDDTEFMSMRTFMNSVVNITTVGRHLTQFGLILYSNEPNSVLTLNKCESKQDILNATRDAVQPKKDTYTSKALQYSLQFFNAEHGGRKASKVPQILMVITDGEATDWPQLKQSSDELRKAGVTIISIGVEREKIEEQRKQLEIMAGGDSSKVFSVKNFKALEALYKNISSVLCNSTKPDCRTSDVVFLLDRSSSITPHNYTVMKNFTKDLVNSFEVRKDFMHCGILQFSTEPHHEFYLGEYLTKEEIFAQIDKMEYTGGSTHLGKALNRTKEYFTMLKGSRIFKNIPQNLVVITDGDSQDEVEEAAEELRGMGVVVFAIAIGDVHDLQLLQMTGTPERLFPVKNFRFGDIKTKVIDALCEKEAPIPDSTDCTIDIAMGFDISERTDEMLISGHNQLKSLLPNIVESVSLVEDLCCLSEPVTTKIAFQVVDRDGSVLYDTDFNVYKREVVEKILTLRVSSPTYFNTALLDSFKNKFKTESNAGVKVLVIFSDGLNEDVKKLKEEKELLRQSGVSALLVVALEGAHTPAELQMVEFGQGFYKTPLSIGMQSVESTILQQIKTVSHRECCNVPCTCTGEEGPRGPKGEPGTKGTPGQSGQPGFPGEEGLPGDRGPPGPNGPTGIQGCPGASGQKGSRGVSGNRGDEGEDGLDGINGEQGLTGPDGARGARGDPGNPGIPGISGEPGLKGDRGLRGDSGEPGRANTTPGAKGEPGNQGLPGLHGTDGRKGAAGVSGSPGPDGRRGADGEKGSPGERGARGLPGIPGAPGPQGRRGGNGELGPNGIPGFPGPQGEPGADGDPGLPGRRGNNGQKGQPGDPGIKGVPGSEGTRGFPGEDGRDGYGPPGPPGAKGDPGFPGYPGGPGEDGFPGTKGYPGHRGNPGRSGNSGRPGESGKPGELGHSGHRGPKGPPGDRDKSTCELITQIRENCVCCTGRYQCPAYPTELVFALDMSEDVTVATFQRQRSALLFLLQNITITESNCPTGARVAVVGYSTYTKYLIRFHDYDHKKQLMDAVENIALERTSNRRRLGSAMRFVARNIFKRIRAGVLMRKVAIFFSGGPSQDTSDILAATMEYQALNIKPALVFMRNAPAISQVLEVDDTGSSIFTVLGRQQDMAADLRKVKNCAICYDPCKRPEECLLIQDTPKPQSVNVDLVMVADSSREMQADEYTGVQQLLGTVVKHLAVSQQPNQANNRARVAVVQSSTQLPKLEFGLQTYQNQDQMRSQIQKMQHQGGSSSLGRTLEYTLREVIQKARYPRRKRALMVVVGSQTAHADRAKLQYISQKAKCEGVALFVVTVGDRYSRTQVEELASEPVQQHLIHVDRLKADEQGYTQRFFRVFLSALNKGINTYPAPSLKQTCDKLTEPDETLTFLNGLGSGEPEEEFRDEAEEQLQMQTGGKTETRQLDVINTTTGRNRQSLLSGANLNDPTVVLKTQLNSSPARSTDACSLSYDIGGCWNYTMKWFFDSNERRCSHFWYGGCGGNANRFETEEECGNLCLSPGGKSHPTRKRQYH